MNSWMLPYFSIYVNCTLTQSARCWMFALLETSLSTPSVYPSGSFMSTALENTHPLLNWLLMVPFSRIFAERGSHHDLWKKLWIICQFPPCVHSCTPASGLLSLQRIMSCFIYTTGVSQGHSTAVSQTSCYKLFFFRPLTFSNILRIFWII